MDAILRLAVRNLKEHKSKTIIIELKGDGSKDGRKKE